VVRGLGHAAGRSGCPSRVKIRPNSPDTTAGTARRQPAEAAPLGRDVLSAWVRSVLASRRVAATTFGPMMHQAAWERNYFLRGGSAGLPSEMALPVNWSIQREHFFHVHADPRLSCMPSVTCFAAAFGGSHRGRGGRRCTRGGFRAVWSGEVATVPARTGRTGRRRWGPPPRDWCRE